MLVSVSMSFITTHLFLYNLKCASKAQKLFPSEKEWKKEKCFIGRLIVVEINDTSWQERGNAECEGRALRNA